MNEFNVVWNMYECNKGNRWTAVKFRPFADSPGRCVFSGCNRRHSFKLVGETTDIAQAGDWFRNNNAKASQEEVK